MLGLSDLVEHWECCHPTIGRNKSNLSIPATPISVQNTFPGPLQYHNYEKSPCLMSKLTISMAIITSYVGLQTRFFFICVSTSNNLTNEQNIQLTSQNFGFHGHLISNCPTLSPPDFGITHLGNGINSSAKLEILAKCLDDIPIYTHEIS